MRLEPDRFHTWDLAVPGGVYRVGSSRSVFAAQAGKTGYPAYFVRNGGGYHAGGRCMVALVEPEMAACTMIAFSKLFLVTISLAVMPFLTSSISCLPAS